MIIILSIITLVLLTTFIFVTLQVKKNIIQINKDITFRAILKNYNNSNLNTDQIKLIKKWAFLFIITFGIIPSILVVILTVRTDYSFLIGIVSIFWLYSIIRYPLLNKEDLK